LVQLETSIPKEKSVRLLAILITLIFLLTACQRYTIGAANSAPRVVSGNESVEYGSVWDTEQADELAPGATHNETVVGGDSEEHSESTEAAEEHSASVPEIDNARLVIREAFSVVRGSVAARRETADTLHAVQESLHMLSESGTISHWEELEESFHTAIEKVREGTNDAPNALNRLLADLDEAAHHE
jgi:hypothetical protein